MTMLTAAIATASSNVSVIDIATLVLALVSLVFSVAALWVSSLKKAHIGVHYAPSKREWQVSSWSGLTPSGEGHVLVAIYAHNGGARAGILENLSVASEGTMGDLFSGPVTWYETKTKSDTHPGNYTAEFPQAIEANDIEELHLVGRFVPGLTEIQRLVGDVAADVEREEAFARKLANAKPLTVTVTWTYARPGWSFRGAKTERKTMTTKITVPAEGIRQQFVSAWRGQGERTDYGDRARRLADLAEGKAT